MLAVGCIFWAIKNITLSEFAALTKLTPVFAGLIGIFFLDQSVTKNEVFCSIFGFIGVVLIVQPDFIYGSKGA